MTIENLPSENLVILRRGPWYPEQIQILRLPAAKKLLRTTYFHKAMEETWKKIRKVNPSSFSGHTFRIAGHHLINDKIIFEEIPTKYKTSQEAGWLGCAMGIMTSDYYLPMQGQVQGIAASIGSGIRIPGCTFKTTDLTRDIIIDVKEEYGVKIGQENILFLGLVEIFPPLAKHQHCIISLIKISITKTELLQKYKKAKDREKEGSLHFARLDPKQGEFFFEGFTTQQIHKVSLLTLAMIAENETGKTRIAQKLQVNI